LISYSINHRNRISDLEKLTALHCWLAQRHALGRGLSLAQLVLPLKNIATRQLKTFLIIRQDLLLQFQIKCAMILMDGTYNFIF